MLQQRSNLSRYIVSFSVSIVLGLLSISPAKALPPEVGVFRIGTANSKLECYEIAQWALRNIGFHALILRRGNVSGLDGVIAYYKNTGVHVDCSRQGNQFTAWAAVTNKRGSKSRRGAALNALRRGYTRKLPKNVIGCWACLTDASNYTYNQGGPYTCLHGGKTSIRDLKQVRLNNKASNVSAYTRACPRARLQLYEKSNFKGKSVQLTKINVFVELKQKKFNDRASSVRFITGGSAPTRAIRSSTPPRAVQPGRFSR